MLSATQTLLLFVIEEKPSGWSVVGALLIALGTFFGIGTIVWFGDFSWLVFMFWVLLWLFILCAGLLFVIYEPASKIIVDHQNRQVRLTRRALFGWNRRILNFDEIKYFRLIERPDENGDSHSVIGLELRNGEILKINLLPRHVEEFESRYILEINEFLRKGCERSNL